MPPINQFGGLDTKDAPIKTMSRKLVSEEKRLVEGVVGIQNLSRLQVSDF